MRLPVDGEVGGGSIGCSHERDVHLRRPQVHRREPHAVLDVVPIRGGIEPVADLATRSSREREGCVAPLERVGDRRIICGGIQCAGGAPRAVAYRRNRSVRCHARDESDLPLPGVRAWRWRRRRFEADGAGRQWHRHSHSSCLASSEEAGEDLIGGGSETEGRAARVVFNRAVTAGTRAGSWLNRRSCDGSATLDSQDAPPDRGTFHTPITTSSIVVLPVRIELTTSPLPRG